MILPVGAKNFEEAMQMGSETYHHLKVLSLDYYNLHAGPTFPWHASAPL